MSTSFSRDTIRRVLPLRFVHEWNKFENFVRIYLVYTCIYFLIRNDKEERNIFLVDIIWYRFVFNQGGLLEERFRRPWTGNPPSGSVVSVGRVARHRVKKKTDSKKGIRESDRSHVLLRIVAARRSGQLSSRNPRVKTDRPKSCLGTFSSSSSSSCSFHSVTTMILRPQTRCQCWSVDPLNY